MTLKLGLAAGLIAAFALPSLALADAALKDPFARATPPNAKNAAVYVTISSEAGDRLLSGASPAATKVQIHDTTVTDGVARMREMENGLEIPAGGSVTLEPGGKHIMLMGLTGPLNEGETVALTLTFEKAGAIEVTAPIRKLDPHAADHDEYGHEGHEGMEGMKPAQ